jgi:hypothetical protein
MEKHMQLLLTIELTLMALFVVRASLLSIERELLHRPRSFEPKETD